MAKFVSGIMFCALLALLDTTSAWKREFLRMPKSNEIGTADDSSESGKNLKSQSELIASMLPKRKTLQCYYGVDMFRTNNGTEGGAFEEVKCDDEDYDRCLIGKCKGQNFVEVRKFCATKDGCAAFGCAVEEELECKTCFGELCNL